jgi:hypothetical protein
MRKTKLRKFGWALAALLGWACAANAGWSAETALRNVIDREITAGWERDKISPAPAANDSEFLRRVQLDLVGGIPTYEETVAFLADK